jgi:hypothetical protein
MAQNADRFEFVAGAGGDQLQIFPGGWQTLADREGFQLPSRYQQ